jgi:hypothetical protein
VEDTCLRERRRNPEKSWRKRNIIGLCFPKNGASVKWPSFIINQLVCVYPLIHRPIHKILFSVSKQNKTNMVRFLQILTLLATTATFGFTADAQLRNSLVDEHDVDENVEVRLLGASYDTEDKDDDYDGGMGMMMGKGGTFHLPA